MAMFSNLVGRRYKISESLGKPLFIIQPVERLIELINVHFGVLITTKNHGEVA
jgi:hypothetical protein